MVDETGGSRVVSAEALSLEQGRAALALGAASMGEFEWDFVRDRFVVSPRMSAITGVPAGETPARGGHFALGFVHPDDLEAVRAAVGERLIRDGGYELRYRMVRPDNGQVQWMESAAVILRGASGPVEKVIGVVRDISRRKAEEDEREALVAELDHRVKNVLAAVQSLAAQSARQTVSLDAFLATFGGRLDAMAAAHTLLTATRWRGADIGDIAAAELGGLACGRARWSGPPMVLNPRATNALALALHELATNAVKYGALSTDAGRIDMTWEAAPDGGFELVWAERRGPPVAGPARRGFGVTLLEKVTGRELGGRVRLEFGVAGVRATLRAGAAALAPSPNLPTDPPVVPPPSNATRLGGQSVGEHADIDLAGVRILVVEDSVLLALELEAGLIEAGAKIVAAASDLEEALSFMELDFDVAVLDADLNGRSVTPVASALAARGVPFIFATGYDPAVAAPEGFGAPVVRKPYHIHQIAAAVVGALDRR
ncbi:MAG: PAS domain-containing protein [Caulobacteraceae bacterium]|nr:PAS domain-containing protein [Caulobacteraceae bacterium]